MWLFAYSLHLVLTIVSLEFIYLCLFIVDSYLLENSSQRLLRVVN